MNPLVKKEIRLLLPNFAIGCVLTLANLLVPQDSNSIFFVLPFLLCPAIVVMLALDSFGAELSSGNFTALLSQPVSRLKIWQTKILLLSLSLFIIGVLYSAVIVLRAAMLPHAFVFGGWLINLLTPVIMLELVAFSGGLWTVLLLRQVAAAFWFTVLIPGVILVILAALFGDKSEEFVEGVAVVVLGIYSLCGLFFARWLFLRAQDLQWSGGTITMPNVRGLPAWLSWPVAKRIGRPRATLLWKEIQLHQSQFIMAFALAVLHLGVIATRKLGHFPRNSSTEFVLETFWLLWLVMPFLVGCAAVAEERKIGTFESQLCLPAKRRTQFAVKLFAVLLLSILFGVAMPLLFEGTRVLPDAQIKLFNAFSAQFGGEMPKAMAQTFLGNCIEQINLVLPLLTLAGMAAAIGAISFYVSTLTRNTLQALAPAALCIILTGSLMVDARAQEFASHPLWRGWLIYFIGLPVMLLVLLALAFSNFRRLAIGWKLGLRNLLALAASLAFAILSTAAIYHRAWDKLTAFEPPHAAARLALANPASLSERGNEISVRLSDGRIWTTHFTSSSISSSPLAFALGNFKVAVDTGRFLEGTNWAMVKSSPREWVGIKTDGTLWVSERSRPAGQVQTGEGQKNEKEMRHLMQFGNETNWSSLQPAYFSVLLVKTDGTLWRWGPGDFDLKHKPWPGLRTFTPHRLGTESNWAEVFETYLRKTDGSIWAQNYNPLDTNRTTLKIDRTLTVRSLAGPGHEKFHSLAEVWRGMDYQVGIRDDGTFRIWADQRLNRSSYYYEWSATDLPIGGGTNWLAVASSGQKTVTLKDDGSLWLWDFAWDPWRGWNPDRDERELQNTIPTRLGTHSDWIAIAGEGGFASVGGCGNIISLAADGSLWYWPLERPSYYSSGDYQFEPLLDISRKPVFLGNVFGKAN